MKKHTSLPDICCYLGFTAVASLRMAEASALVSISAWAGKMLILLSAVLFFMKIFSEKYPRKAMLAIVVLAAVFFYIYLMTESPFILIGFLAFFAMKNIDFRKIVKMDIILKSAFITLHAGLYLLDYLFNPSFLPDINSSGAHALYSTNPNVISGLLLWLIIDILYLKKHRKPLDYIVALAIMTAMFVFTQSRTPLLCLAIFIVLSALKNEKIVNIMQKSVYPILAVLSFLIVNIVKKGYIYKIINATLSGRLGISIAVYNSAGLSLLPLKGGLNLLETYVIDNFYVRCLVFYGVLTLILFYIPCFLMPKKGHLLEKRISIVSSISLFFESLTMNVGMALPYLIMANSILNKKDKNENS